MHGCMTEYVVCNHPRADGRIAVLVAVIKDVVLRMNLDLHNCRDQCYDGAANMAGSRTGTATQLRHVEERAMHIYTLL